MGHKVWWRRGLELLVLFSFHRTILGDGDVGCLFSTSLCNPRTETCYNDLAFGKCIPQYADLDDDELYQYDFDSEELLLLRLQLEMLELDGYKWKHPYTQCVMQTSLYNIRHGQTYDIRDCQRFQQYESFNQENKISQEARVPAIAIVKFAPNNANFENSFTNELYYPSGTQTRYVQRRSLPGNEPFQRQYKGAIGEDIARTYRPRYSSLSYNEYDSLPDEENGVSPPLRIPIAVDDYDEKLYRIRRDYGNSAIESIKNALAEEKLTRQLLEDEALAKMQSLPNDQLEFLLDDPPSDYPLQSESDSDSEQEYEKAFSRKYKHQRKFPSPEFLENGKSWLDSVKRNLKENDKTFDYEENAEDDNTNVEVDDPPKSAGIFTEGGFVEPVEEKPADDTMRNDYDSLLDSIAWRRELAGFKRRERLDVKKPGPLYSTNNYAFKTPQPPENENEDRTNENQNNDELLMPLVKKEHGNSAHQSKRLPGSYNNVDLDYVYVEFQQPFHTWSEGEHVVKEVAKELGLVPGTLRDIRVGRAEVTFKVVRNNRNYNATDVASNIDTIRGKLRDTLGVEVIRAGIGDKAKLPATLEVARETQINSSIFGAVVAAGITAATAAAAVTLIIARRHAKSRAKLAGLATPDPEASKEYQDLCRARMQAKQPTEKPESPRITSLSRESDSNNAGSNRSSTSSWSDEQTLSNLDTSIGHVVLSYMEDHLKNQDKLDQEWAALCAYVADPSSTENAEKEENIKKNRPGAPLPYDHSRVVLNHLANADDSDYINASTITDHDPRNPAYISTQGPLVNSTAEFWQMVWEQGSVVIVMLTRLTEDGVAMCHRYWPEQEYEQYHIYEVHLLSEYPGCDDYLVRSFYLKNLETGETRTVTQFHFLSWPENRVPHSTKALLEFRRKVNKSYRGRSCPIVVHCSDGAGRTGTYCLIDMVLNRMMKGAKEIDIAATFEHIRDQRANMVATKQQYEFVFVAVTEEVRANLKALPVAPAEKSPAASGSKSPNHTSN